MTTPPITIGDLIAELYPVLVHELGCDDLAAVVTAAIVNESILPVPSPRPVVNSLPDGERA